MHNYMAPHYTRTTQQNTIYGNLTCTIRCLTPVHTQSQPLWWSQAGLCVPLPCCGDHVQPVRAKHGVTWLAMHYHETSRLLEHVATRLPSHARSHDHLTAQSHAITWPPDCLITCYHVISCNRLTLGTWSPCYGRHPHVLRFWGNLWEPLPLQGYPPPLVRWPGLLMMEVV